MWPYGWSANMLTCRRLTRLGRCADGVMEYMLGSGRYWALSWPCIPACLQDVMCGRVFLLLVKRYR